MYAFTGAHKTYPLGTVLLVTNPKNGKSLEVRINDRGPFWNNRELDLSMGAAEYLGTKRAGVATVNIEVISVPKIAQSFVPIKSKKPLKPHYNLGYTASCFAELGSRTKRVPVNISTFLNKREAKGYLRKIKRYIPKAYIIGSDYNFKIKFYLKAKKSIVIKKLKQLKRKGLISGYGLFFSSI